jgi:glycosyltransferase involved in cell wall biosynthesis
VSAPQPDGVPTGPPRVAIVVPAYNREEYLGRTLDSVLAQTVTQWQLVVSDDGSTDGTADVAKEYAERDSRITVVHAPNGGVASARNRGYARADAAAEYVTFLDSDDRWYPDTLEVMIAELEARPELVSVYGVASCIDDADRPIPGDDMAERMHERYEYRGSKLVPLAADASLTFGAMMYHNYTVTPGLHLIRREVVDRVGPFDTATDPADDWDLAIRISRCGPIGFLDRLVLQWRRHPATLTNTSPRWRRAHYRVRAKALTAPENTPAQRRLARMGYVGACRGLLRGSWSALRRGRFRDAALDAGRSGDVLLKYLRAAVPAAVARRRGTGDTRSAR